MLVVSSCFTPHVYFMVGQWTCISSVDTFLYPYALPFLIIPYYFLKSLPKLQPELKLKVVTPTELWASAIQSWLSALIIVAVIWGKSSSLSNVQSQTAFFVVLTKAIYSASTEEIVMVGCFFEDQETEFLAMSKMNPPTKWQSLGSWTQLELVYPTKSKLSFVCLFKTKPKSIVF